MARMIDGDRLLKMMAHWKPYMNMDKVRKVVKNMPTLTPPNEWISVKERLPETRTVLATDGVVVITAPASSVAEDGPAITHWMPLPEPPEEER